jgi:hypothetical protein
MRESFVLFTSIREIVEQLTDEQKGVLFTAILDYEIDGEVNINDLAVKLAFTPIKQQLDRTNTKWDNEKQKRSEAGKKGMANRWGNRDNTVITRYNKNNTVIPIEEPTDKTNYQEIADLYNSICVSYPKLKALSDARKKAIKARLKKYTVDDIKRVFEKAEQSDFLKGGNGRNWAASFDWLLKDSNFAKVLDGNYDNKQGVTNGRRNNIDISAPNSRQRADYEEVDKLLWG